MEFCQETFLLSCDTAKRLYQDYAKEQPIFDYHCHLSPQEIWEDRPFEDIGQLWLGGDHYKWRVMRLAGLPERVITGDASWEEKFCAFAGVLENLCGNPVYHWAQMELAVYFDIYEPLTKENAKEIYEKANRIIKERGYSPRTMIRLAKVKLVGTTDDPADSLEFHKKIRDEKRLDCQVVGTFRPDLALMPTWDGFGGWIEKMAALGFSIENYSQLVDALEQRLMYFAESGVLSSDHSLEVAGEYLCYTPSQADLVLKKALKGEPVTEEEQRGYFWRLLTDLSGLYRKHNLVMQLHMGALRGVNTPYRQRVGANTGFDVMDDYLVARTINRFLDQAEMEYGLPKTILYPLNAQQFQVLAAAAASFPQEGIRGKVQLGAAWWHNDHKEGIEAQLLAIAQQGLLPYFVGMLTDSRSFLSYARHDYFRRILCSFIGDRMEKGEFLASEEAAGKLVERICYGNAAQFFQR